MTSKDSKSGSFDFDLRLRGARYVILALFVALGIRFYFLQVAQYRNYTQLAESNRIREIPIIAPRGAILDRNGTFLVDNTPAFNIIVLSPRIEDGYRPNTRLDSEIRNGPANGNRSAERGKRDYSRPRLEEAPIPGQPGMERF